ncbi:hypothetical protein L249_1102 [Ophiocordyceps polyrhachis-furcata BCC 54312]|uniref:Uncharacterized protein n=1 Tax=Ophiocordyceps polyrhachis-furcata BCC 54312 TaxID=1330021 RepID=A0A367LD55_9HYPO|nr:hypothetical protein L249_1102 [Ophiocordyceps polyrhachis-furcata BCC 54312]
MKLQIVALILASTCLAEFTSNDELRQIEAVTRDLETIAEAPGKGHLTKRAAACSLLCCHKKSFEGICAKCAGVCNGGGKTDDDDDDESPGQASSPVLIGVNKQNKGGQPSPGGFGGGRGTGSWGGGRPSGSWGGGGWGGGGWGGDGGNKDAWGQNSRDGGGWSGGW